MVDSSKVVSVVAGGGRASAMIPAFFHWPIDDLTIPAAGCGLGNPWQSNLKNQAEPFREQFGFWIFERDAVTHALVLKGASTMAYFATGEGQPPPATVQLPAFLQNEANTNLFQDGTPVTRDLLFAAVALGVGIGRPFALTRNVANTDYLPVRSYAPWVDSYGERMRDLIFSSVGLRASYRNSAQNIEFGNIQNYPQLGGQYGGPTVRSGGGFGVMGMIPILRGPLYLGAQDESNQCTITATSVLEDLVCDEDGMAPTVGDVAVPMVVTAYGDYGNWCGPCAPTAGDIDALVNARMAPAIAAALQQLGINPAQLKNGAGYVR